MSYQEVNIKIVFLYFLFFSVFAFGTPNTIYASQSVEQKKLTKTEYYGDFSKAIKQKSTGKITLVIWEPYLQHMNKIGAASIIPTVNLTIDCDEIWETKYFNGWSKQEIKRMWNKLDISRIYWKDGKVQAVVVLKQFILNPITNKKLPKTEHKIIGIDSRAQILEKL